MESGCTTPSSRKWQHVMHDANHPPRARAGMTVSLGTATLVFKAVSADTGGAYALMAYLAEPDAGSGFHTHTREDEAFYVLSGVLEVTFDGQTMTALPGTHVHIPRGRRHAFRNPGPDRLEALILVAPGGLEQFFAEFARLIETGSANSAQVGLWQSGTA
jgi:quercetin dioxygenase-like cupin family protein